MLGIGVIINEMGRESFDLTKYYDKRITSVDSNDEHFDIHFDDGCSIRIRDGGQSCCEHRYMTCDDDVSKIIGSKLTNIELREGPTEEMEWGNEHQTMFVEIATDECFVTLTTHNEHNGWYGGFSIVITSLDDGVEK